MDRGESPAFAVLTNASRRAFAAIEKAIGDGSHASVSYVDFRLDYHIGRKSVSPALKQLSALGLLDIQPGPRLVNIFRFSNRWRTIDAVEAVRKYNAAARSDIPAQKRSAAVRNRWSRTALASTSAGARRPRASEAVMMRSCLTAAPLGSFERLSSHAAPPARAPSA
jgi:hypothetical protein